MSTTEPPEVPALAVIVREFREHGDHGPSMTEFICPECKQKATRLTAAIKRTTTEGKGGPYCGRICYGKRLSRAGTARRGGKPR